MNEALSRLRDLVSRTDDASDAWSRSRRAEDRIREEHHDAHARIVAPGVHAAVGSPVAASPWVTIHMVRTPPAPIMDGFDLAGLRAGATVVVEERVGRYLRVAGYGVLVRDAAVEPAKH